MTDYTSRIGATIKALRQDRRLSQQDLADLTGHGAQQTIQKIERGTRQVGLVEAVRIAEALGCELDDLISAVKADLVDDADTTKASLRAQRINKFEAELEKWS